MPKTRLNLDETDTKGIHYISPIFEVGMKASINEINQRKDYGFDFTVNFFEKKDESKNLIYNSSLMRVQLKSGDSYIFNEDEDSFIFYVNEKDIDVWRDSNTPVILIVYKESDNKAFWINIRKYIIDVGYKGNGSLKIIFDKKNELNTYSKIEFLKIINEEKRGIPNTFIRTYKPLYNYLLEKYNTEDKNKLSEFAKPHDKILNVNLNHELTNESLKIKIDYSLSQRKLYSLANAISNLEHIQSSVESKNFNITEVLKSEYYYYLCILYIEDNNIEKADTMMSQLIKKKNNFLKKRRHQIKLLEALIEDLKGGNNNKALDIYDTLIDEKKLKNNSLKGIVCLFAGVICRKLDVYEKSKKYLLESEKLLKYDPYLLAIIHSNLGGLFYLSGDNINSSKYYNSSLELFKNIGDSSAISKTYRNLALIKENTSFWGTTDKFYKLSIQSKPRSEFEEIENYDHSAYYNLSEEIFDTVVKNSESYNYHYFDGIQEFEKEIRLCDHVGDLYGKRMAMQKYGKYLLTLGKLRKDTRLNMHALSLFVIVNYEDGIKFLSYLSIEDKHYDKFLAVLENINGFIGDEISLLGRLNFYRYFTNYIPQEYINLVLKNILSTTQKEYFFRKALFFALSSILDRVSKTDSHKILGIILKKVKSPEIPFYEEKVSLLKKISFKHFNENDINRIITWSEIVLQEPHMSDKVYDLWQTIILKGKHNVTRLIFSKLIALTNNQTKNNFFEYAYLSIPAFKEFRSKDLNKKIVELYCQSLKDESERESHNNFGMGQSYPIQIFRMMYPQVSTQLKKIIINSLTEYIKHENLIPDKRTEAINAISYSKKIKFENPKLLFQIFNEIINNEFKELESRYYEERTIFGHGFDFKSLKAKSLLFLTEHKIVDAKYLLINYFKLIEGDLKDESVDSIIEFLGRFGLRFKKNNKYLNIVLTQLLLFSSSENSDIARSSLYYYSTLLKFSKEPFQTFFFQKLSTLLTKNDSVLYRIQAASICHNLKQIDFKNEKLNSLVAILKKDQNWEVRKRLKSIK